MKNVIIALCVTTLSATTLVPVSAFAVDLPPLKEGLWEISSTSANSGTTNAKHCVDAATMEELFGSSQKMLGSQCSDLSMTKQGDSYSSLITCKMMGSTVQVSSLLTGDFSSEYKTTTKTTFSPPLMGQSGDTIEQVAKHVGPCGAGLEPGDVVLENGQKINARKMMEQMPDIGKMMEGMQTGEMPDPEQMKRLVEQMQKSQQ